jgi:thymidylate synthase
MKPVLYHSFSEAIGQAGFYLQYRSKVVHSNRWQGSDITQKPEMATHEVSGVSFSVDLGSMEHLDTYRREINPQLPWCDDHFEERVCGYPINPGVEWKNWAYGKSAERFLENGKFNHNYMERYWPKLAGMLNTPTKDAEDWDSKYKDDADEDSFTSVNSGIKYSYGDLNDVVKLLAGDPFTRQAYLPIWFPEDTGGGDKRAPCTIGYHFMMRDNKLDINYHIRSCDYVRHFRDDLYLTVRLLLWVLEQCRGIDPEYWNKVVPGKFLMQIGSLHVFRNDYQMLFGNK